MNINKLKNKGWATALLSAAVLLASTLSYGQQAAGNHMQSIPAMTANRYQAPEKAEDISPLLAGETIPQAMLKDAAGKDFSLNAAVAVKPTVLVFYRGGWCPYCAQQLAGLQELMPELKDNGMQLIAVSTDSPEALTTYTEEKHPAYILLSDADLKLSRQFGIAFKAPKAYEAFLPKTSGGKNKELLLPVPSVFILDKNGVIRFEYINPDFRQRLDPELLNAAVQALRGKL